MVDDRTPSNMRRDARFLQHIVKSLPQDPASRELAGRLEATADFLVEDAHALEQALEEYGKTVRLYREVVGEAKKLEGYDTWHEGFVDGERAAADEFQGD